MDKKVEIAKMAEFIHGAHDKTGSCKTAQALVEAGYGDKKQAIKEFAEYLINYAKACEMYGYSGICAGDIKQKLKEYLK